MGKTLTNAIEANIDISMFHAPDRKWRNYYYEDEEQNLLFLLPSYLFYGPIVVDLDWARNAKFEVNGVVHMLKDYSWSLSSNARRTCYPKTVVTDRAAKCGRKTVLLGQVVLGMPAGADGSEGRCAVDYANGDTLDNRLINVSYGRLKENNDRRHSSDVPLIEYPFEAWWRKRGD